MKKKELDKSKCPDFDYFDFEPILKWAGAEVKFSDKFWNAKTNKVTKRPELAHWTLFWQKGFIGFDNITKRGERKKARMAGALFIYLWCKGVQASIADNCASLYARNVSMRKI